MADAATSVEEGIARMMALMHSGEHVVSRLRMADCLDTTAELASDLPLDPTVCGPRGALQGGLLATQVDTIAGRLAMRDVEPGSIVVTTDLTVHYLAGVTASPCHAEATTLRRSKRSVVIRVDVFSGHGGEHAASCTVAFKVVTPKL